MSASSVIVVGAGLAGASTAWRLAQRGFDVTVVERDVPGSPWGSSHGSARIFRYAYANPFYAGLVAEARAGWDEVERDTGRPLITTTGAIDHGSMRDPSVLAPILDGIGIASEVLSAEAAGARWPGLRFHGPALYHSAAGVLDAVGAVDAFVRLATAAGARFRTGWTVKRVEADGAGYRVRSTDGETLTAGQVVVAAGGWLPDLLGALDLAAAEIARFPTLVVRQEQAIHLPYREPGEVWPTFIHKEPGMEIYSLPGGRDAGGAGQKLAQFNGGRVIRSAAEHDRIVDPVNVEHLVEYARRELPGLVPEPYAAVTCLFTATPTEDFVIDRVGGITVLSPCSGHGAKFAPLIGEYAARLVEDGSRVPDVFRPLSGTVMR